MSPVNTTPNVPQRNFIPELYTGTSYRNVISDRVDRLIKGRRREAGGQRVNSVTGAFHDRIIIIKMPEKAEDPEHVSIIDRVIDGL